MWARFNNWTSGSADRCGAPGRVRPFRCDRSGTLIEHRGSSLPGLHARRWVRGARVSYRAARTVWQPFDLDVASAKQNGYDIITVSEESPNLQTWFTELDPTIKERFYLAAFGPEPDGDLPVIDATDPGDVRDVLPERLGCNGYAESAVYGDTNAYESVRLQLQAAYNNSYTAALSTEAMADLEASWSECMETSGYAFDSPGDAFDAVAAQPVSEQVSVAAADAECRQSTGYAVEAEQLLWQHQLDWIEGHPGVLDEFATLRLDAVERAKDLARADG